MVREIPLVIESGQRMRGWHWRRYHAYKRRMWDALGLFFPARDARCPRVRMAVVITSFNSPIRDVENLIQGCKPIPDWLKRAGYIYEDADEWLALRYERVRDGKGERVMVEVMTFTIFNLQFTNGERK
jgi:hypothetical protein